LYSGKKKKRTDGDINTQNTNTSRKIRFYHQLHRKRINIIEETGILGIPIRQQKHDNISPRRENFESNQANSTTSKATQEVVSLDSRVIREDDFHDPSNRRGSTTHSLPTTGPFPDSTSNKPELGSNMQVVLYQA
jgi:hypothetical protein